MKDESNEPLNDSSSGSRFNKRWLISGAMALLAIIAATLFWQRSSQPRNTTVGRAVPTVEEVSSAGAGRTVPTVEEVSSASPSTTTAGKADLTIAPEMIGRINLKTEEARMLDVANQLRLTGTVQPNAYRETRVMPIAGGRVTEVKTQLGDFVKIGQTLAVLFSTELAEAQMKYLSINANYEFHEAQHKRYQKLSELGAISQQEMEEVSARLQEHHAEYAAIRQRLKLLGLTDKQIDGLSEASQVTSEVKVTAPASGVITARNVNPGQVITMADALFSVTDLSNVWVMANVYEKDFNAARIGARVTITTAASPGGSFNGTISYLDPRVDPMTRTAQARIEVANPGQMLRLGMFVDVTLNAPGTRTGLVIPKSALQSLGNDMVVFVPLAEPGRFQTRAVQVEETTGGLARVISGLSAGEKVVTEGSFFLRAEKGRSGN